MLDRAQMHQSAIRTHCNSCSCATTHDTVASAAASDSDLNPDFGFVKHSGVFSILRCRGCERTSFQVELKDAEDDNEPLILKYPQNTMRRSPSWTSDENELLSMFEEGEYDFVPGEIRWLIREVYGAMQ